MSKAKTFALFVIILIIAIFLRTYHLKTELAAPPGLYPDEAMNGNNALEAIATAPPAGGFKVFYPENNGREGLFINIQAIFVKYFGNQPWVLRLPSAIFGILTVIGVYFLTKELFGYEIIPISSWTRDKVGAKFYESAKSDSENFSYIPAYRQAGVKKFVFRSEYVALLAMFLTATSFWHINFSRIGFRAIMAPAFLTWAIYFLLKSLNRIRINSPFLLSAFYFLLSGLLYGLGIHSYIAYRATPPLILLIIGWYFWQNKDWVVRRRILLVACLMSLVALLVFAPLGRYFLQHPADFFGRTTQVSVMSSPSPPKDLAWNVLKTAGMFNFVGDFNWRHNYSGRPELFWPVGILFLIGIFLGIKQFWTNPKSEARNTKQYQNTNDQNSKTFGNSNLEHLNLFRNSNFGFCILFAWLAVAALPVVISNEGLPHALRSILMIPPVFILAGYGGIWLYYKIAPQTPRIILLSTFYFLLAILASQAYYQYFIRWAPNPNTRDAFAANYVELGRELNALPVETPKYVIVNASGTDIRGLPMPTQTVMFLTDTFTPEKQKAKNIFYVLPADESKIPPNALKFYMQ